MQKNILIVIVGPTAVGKTVLAIRLAQHFRTEVVSADSRQIYMELEIGTAKPTSKDLRGVPHHFLSTHSIKEEYSAGRFGVDARALLTELFEKFRRVVLCGGSGLYVKAVCESFDEMPVVPQGVREKIMTDYEKHGLAWLQQRVEEVDPDYFAEVDQKNPHRLVRALELNYASGISMKDLRKKTEVALPFDVIKIGIELDRDELNARIDNRMDKMISDGLFEEAQSLFPLRHLNSLQTVGYQEIFGFLEGQYDREEAIRLLKRNSRRYAKRQLTWFKKDKSVRWFSPEDVTGIIHYIESGHE